MHCDRCGQALTIGDWPFCPHGRGAGTVIADAIPGGQLIENLGPVPVRVYSESERRRLMKERGLVDAVRHVHGSALTSNWHTADQTTLDNAAALVDPARRVRTPAREDVEVPATFTITERADGFKVTPDGEAHS
jgi:hypothetical protein